MKGENLPTMEGRALAFLGNELRVLRERHAQAQQEVERLRKELEEATCISSPPENIVVIGVPTPGETSQD